MKNEIKREQFLNLRNFIPLLKRNKFIFAISFIITSLLAIIYLAFTEPEYKLRTSVFISQENPNIPSLENISQNLHIYDNTKNMENEMGILKSDMIIGRTLQALSFEVSYFKEEWGKTKEIYNSKPFIVKVDSSKEQIINTQFYINPLSDNSFQLIINAQNIIPKKINDIRIAENTNTEDFSLSINGLYGIPITNEYFSITIFKNPSIDFKNEHSFKINNFNELINKYKEEISLNPTSKGASIIDISLIGGVVEKQIDFLNKLSEVFILQEKEEKNEIANNTILFIDQQLSEISDSLENTENRLEKFRQKDKVIDVNFHAKNSFEKLQKLEAESAILITQNKYYNYLKDYVSYNKDITRLVAPATMGAEDVLLNNLVNEINKLTSEKVALSYSAKNKNPGYNILDLKLENAKKTLVENVNSIIKASEIELQENKKRINATVEEVNKLPKSEKTLVNIQRMFNHNDYIFNFLLEKRAAAGISKASSLPGRKILDKATVVGEDPIKPNKAIVLIITLILSFVFPIGFIVSKDLFTQVIKDKDHLSKYIDFPIIELNLNPIDNSQDKYSFWETAIFLCEKLNSNDKKIINITSLSDNLNTDLDLLTEALSNLKNKVILLNFISNNEQNFSNTINDYDMEIVNYFNGKLSIQNIITKKSNFNYISINTSSIKDNNYFKYFSNLLDQLNSEYDLIIINTHNLNYSSDFSFFAKKSNVNLILIGSEITKIEEVEKLNKKLELHQIKDKYSLLIPKLF